MTMCWQLRIRNRRSKHCATSCRFHRTILPDPPLPPQSPLPIPDCTGMFAYLFLLSQVSYFGDETSDGEREGAEDEEGERVESLKLADVEAEYGSLYRRMVASIHDTVSNARSIVHEAQRKTSSKPGSVNSGESGGEEGVTLAGFVWFQGFNDQFEGAHKEYASHLTNLIRDIRKETKTAALPVVIEQMGQGGALHECRRRGQEIPHENFLAVKAAQAKVATQFGEGRGVALVETEGFWDWEAQKEFDKGWESNPDWEKWGSNFPYHYLGSPYTFLKIGQAFGDAMVKLRIKIDST
jgi:hypothetical protein